MRRLHTNVCWTDAVLFMICTILELLKDGRKTAGEISNSFNLTGATVSYHLSNLKKANLITETKQKNFIFYELNSSVFEDVLVWIYKLGGNKNGKEK